ncbi:MAG: hypothetical protein QOJ35_3453 [Solirubrobacteraceae bacterium]|nr:hypothetical protein [Solirubrobacteraceae bacterium]
MKKLVMVATLAALAATVPAQANKGADRAGGPSADRGQARDQGAQARAGKGDRGSARSRRCTPRRAGYVAAGLYVSSALQQVAGADTPTPRDDRYDGTLVVDVKRGNHAASADEGTQKTYALAGVRVRFADRNDDGTRDQPVAGDRVKLDGKLTKLRGGCDASAFEPQLTIARVQFLPPPQQEDGTTPPTAPAA